MKLCQEFVCLELFILFMLLCFLLFGENHNRKMNEIMMAVEEKRKEPR